MGYLRIFLAGIVIGAASEIIITGRGIIPLPDPVWSLTIGLVGIGLGLAVIAYDRVLSHRNRQLPA